MQEQESDYGDPSEDNGDVALWKTKGAHDWVQRISITTFSLALSLPCPHYLPLCSPLTSTTSTSTSTLFFLFFFNTREYAHPTVSFLI